MKDEIPQDGIIIYNTEDGESKISLFARDGSAWFNKNQMSEFFATSKKNVSRHVISALEDKELKENSVVKYYLTTAPDDKNYQVAFYHSSASGRSKTLRNLCARGSFMTLLPGGLPIKGKAFHGQQIFLPRFS